MSQLINERHLIVEILDLLETANTFTIQRILQNSTENLKGLLREIAL